MFIKGELSLKLSLFQAEALVLTLRDLFQCVYEVKKKEVEDAKHKIDEPEPVAEVKEDAEPVYSVSWHNRE